MKKYYLAYGSNLNKMQMGRRCRGAKPIGTATIPDYELLFKGSKTGAYLTIEKNLGSSVPVAVWEVNEEHEKNLDRYEGFPNFYYKKNMDVILDGSGETITAFVYIMHEERNLEIPFKPYVEICKQGYNDFGFDLQFLKTAIERTFALKRNQE